MKAHRILSALNRSQNTKDFAMKSWTPLSNICALKISSYSWFQSIELRDDLIMRLYMLEIWQCDNHQSASMKKRISDHKEKMKPDQKQKQGAVWTTQLSYACSGTSNSNIFGINHLPQHPCWLHQLLAMGGDSTLTNVLSFCQSHWNSGGRE